MIQNLKLLIRVLVCRVLRRHRRWTVFIGGSERGSDETARTWGGLATWCLPVLGGDGSRETATPLAMIRLDMFTSWDLSCSTWDILLFPARW